MTSLGVLCEVRTERLRGNHVRLHVSVCVLVSAIKQSVRLSSKSVQELFTKSCGAKLEFRENRLIGSHPVLKTIKEILLVTGIFLTDVGEIQYLSSTYHALVNLWILCKFIQ